MGCRQTGLVVLGPPGEPELEACKRSLGVDEVLDAAALAQRFPGFRLQAGQVAVLDSTAGVLFADRALRAAQVGAAGGMECFGMTRDDLGWDGGPLVLSSQPTPVTLPTQEGFCRHGGTLRDGQKVLHIEPGPMVTVTTTAGVYKAPRLIITAGAWTGAFVEQLGLRLPLQVRVGGTGGGTITARANAVIPAPAHRCLLLEGEATWECRLGQCQSLLLDPGAEPSPPRHLRAALH